MPTLQINYKFTENLIPYANNSRTHSEDQINQVASSIKEFGFTNPVLIDEQGGIIAGHGRVMAAKKLGLAEVPTITLEGLTKAQVKAYVIADNQLALNSGWELDVLKLEVETLGEMDFDISLLGFDDSFSLDLLSGAEDDGNLSLTPEEKLENYMNGDTKILRLAYTQEEIESVTAMLDEYLNETELEDYSTAVFSMLRTRKK
mgnify:FL=1